MKIALGVTAALAIGYALYWYDITVEQRQAVQEARERLHRHNERVMVVDETWIDRLERRVFPEGAA